MVTKTREVIPLRLNGRTLVQFGRNIVPHLELLTEGVNLDGIEGQDESTRGSALGPDQPVSILLDNRMSYEHFSWQDCQQKVIPLVANAMAVGAGLPSFDEQGTSYTWDSFGQSGQTGQQTAQSGTSRQGSGRSGE